MQNILSGFLDTILGPSEDASKTNRKYVCPFHISNPPGKKKLEIDIETDENGHNKWACWACGEKGKSAHSLLYRMGVDSKYIAQLNKIVVRNPNKKNEVERFNGILPAEYIFLPDADSKNIIAKHARFYLKKRNITEEDIYRYRIGFCDDGDYAERIIIPSYDIKGNMNFFVGRSFEPEPYLKYKFPKVSKDIIPFEFYINWDLPIILCEGGFDMIAIKRNVIPLLGKTMSPSLKKKIISSRVEKVYVVLDKDAMKESLSHCEELMSFGKKVYLVPLTTKDPSEMGFEKFTRLISGVKAISSSELMKYKMNL